MEFQILKEQRGTLVDSSLSHSVCVCTIYENTALLLNAVKLNVDVNNLEDLIICGRTSRACMMHDCSNCPGTDPLHAATFVT